MWGNPRSVLTVTLKSQFTPFQERVGACRFAFRRFHFTHYCRIGISYGIRELMITALYQGVASRTLSLSAERPVSNRKSNLEWHQSFPTSELIIVVISLLAITSGIPGMHLRPM
jgi:hypothetical protein